MPENQHTKAVRGKEGHTVRAHALKMTTMALLVAMGYVLSPILRVPGMAPMQHFINVICAALLGPWYALLCACLIAALRMTLMGINLLAVTGAVFGATLSGLLYRRTGKLLAAVIGEVIGTGIIGAIASWPVMRYIYGVQEVVWITYVPSFVLGTLIGGAAAMIFLLSLQKRGLLAQMQRQLGTLRPESGEPDKAADSTDHAGHD